jgi:hypothetical protein
LGRRLKRGQGKRSHHAGRAGSENTEIAGPIGPVGEQVKNLIRRRAAEMVNAVIEKALSGNQQALKYLFELAGVFPEAMPEETPAQGLLAKAVLRSLGISEEEALQAANHHANDPLEADAVK